MAKKFLRCSKTRRMQDFDWVVNKSIFMTDRSKINENT